MILLILESRRSISHSPQHVWILIEICFYLQYSNIALDNGMAPVRRQAILWTNIGWLLFYWCIYASLSLNELSLNVMICQYFSSLKNVICVYPRARQHGISVDVLFIPNILAHYCQQEHYLHDIELYTKMSRIWSRGQNSFHAYFLTIQSKQ